jgi:hypothetical protein
VEEPDLLPFYREFFTENLFLVPEPASGTTPPTDSTKGQPVKLPAPEVAEAIMGDTPVAKKFLVLGENRKGLVLLFSLPAAAFAALPGNVFLTKILAAIQHTPADVAYVNLEQNFAVNIFDLGKETKVQQVVAFGSGLVDMAPGSKINLYKPAGIGQVPLLLADPLHHIENDVNRKKQLWSGLQSIFLK